MPPQLETIPLGKTDLRVTPLGRFVKQTGTREQLVVATKFAPTPWRWRRNSLVSALRRSLNRLGFSQVDLYQVHFPLPHRAVEHWANAFDHVPPGMRSRIYRRDYLAKIQLLIALLKEIGQTHDKTPAQISLNWLIVGCYEPESDE